MFPSLYQVAWEILSYTISGPGNIIRDLLFLGRPGSGVTTASSERRPDTGTSVVSFTGCQGYLEFIVDCDPMLPFHSLTSTQESLGSNPVNAQFVVGRYLLVQSSNFK